MIHNKYEIEEKQINIAILTESIDDNEVEEKLQRFDIVKEIINHRYGDMPTTKFEIKNRIVQVLQQKSDLLFDLEENGYMISELKEMDNSRRPYIIIFFDNPNTEGEKSAERSLKKLAKVYLYVSIGSNAIDDNFQQYKDRMFFIQRYILRDLLTYRNRILRCLERDFSGDIFARYARTTGEKNILSHEKANSHNTTADDEISIEIFMRPDLFEEGKYNPLSELMATKWLLLRNYTNGQIAKMFNRGFSDSREKATNAPKLYLRESSVSQEKFLFKQKLDCFEQLGLDTDGRFQFLKTIVDFNIAKDIQKAEFIKTKKGFGYNQEYFKCILIDICMSAIKFQSYQSDYLLRIKQYMEDLQILDALRQMEKQMEWVNSKIEKYEKKRCRIEISKEHGEGNVDYLVISNPVNKLDHNLLDWEERNKTIEKRLHDPLDFIDGHMSLLAIKRYIENLDKTIKMECSFKYIQHKENEMNICFETKLPVLSGGSNENNILD